MMLSPFFLASMSRKDQSRWFGLIGFFKELRRLQQFELQKQQQQQHLLQQVQLQLVTPIMTRRKTRPKKTSPETMYTIADVIEMETEASISFHHIRRRGRVKDVRFNGNAHRHISAGKQGC